MCFQFYQELESLSLRNLYNSSLVPNRLDWLSLMSTFRSHYIVHSQTRSLKTKIVILPMMAVETSPWLDWLSCNSKLFLSLSRPVFKVETSRSWQPTLHSKEDQYEAEARSWAENQHPRVINSPRPRSPTNPKTPYLSKSLIAVISRRLGNLILAQHLKISKTRIRFNSALDPTQIGQKLTSLDICKPTFIEKFCHIFSIDIIVRLGLLKNYNFKLNVV